MRTTLLSIFFVAQVIFACAQQTEGIFPVEQLGNTIYSGVFTGNGLLGTMTYRKSNHAIRIDIGRTDVYDHRKNSETALFDKARLPIGHFEWSFMDTIQQAVGRMDYRNAEAEATVIVGGKPIVFRTITFAHRDIIYIELSGDLSTFEQSGVLQWVSEQAKSPRVNFAHAKKPDQYPPNPPAHTGKQGDVQFHHQPLLAGGGYSVAWKRVSRGDKPAYLVSVAYDTVGSDHLANAVTNVRTFPWRTLDEELQQHRLWWQKYYAKSSINIPDPVIQQFYHMQLYKLASATGDGRPAMDLQGPWTANTPWPAYWHNLNIQLAYSPTFTANHLEISKSLIQMIDRNVDNLIRNVPAPYQYNSAAIGRSSAPDMVSPVYVARGKDGRAWDDGKREVGNLTWMLHSYYQYYRYSMDSSVYDRLFPLLKRSVNYYLHLLDEDEQGRYHIVEKTYSPEYGKGYAYDTNYDLAILRWGLQALIALDDERPGRDPLYERWKDVRANLRDYPQDEDGFMIAKDVPYAESHRHYSHLMMIYPFYDVHWEQSENRDLIVRSMQHWQSKDAYLQGYSFTGAASMYAMMGDGDKALQSLQTLLKHYVKPNTLYAETGPVIETPLAAMTSIQELCLQYWNETARIFPAMPKTWRDVSFHDLLTDGAFLVSAERKEGKTTHVVVKSQYDGVLRLQTGIWEGDVRIHGKGKLLERDGEEVLLQLVKGDVATITRDTDGLADKYHNIGPRGHVLSELSP
ncbi:glycosyl hydrolase family 95 catalytic domain-containing protein [Sphingobacterium suaedae]|uniref:Glycosyl hydrolase family 95 catalytic domain-containing protein n=1 Tax=Sphingobacterium suaedae TaxID=1686402 RepID=A0ABW5KJ21_9SPHI